jgi:ribosomal protein L37AE/L43A
MSGMDVAMELLNLHNRARADLGKTKLRHKYALPCPTCSHDVGRDDGTTIVDCKNCGSSWTERHYKFLVGLTIEGKEKDLLKDLLAQAYERLDRIQALITTMAGDDTINHAGAGIIILEALKQRLDGHPKPEQRTDKRQTTQRQTDEDQWSWAGERPYKRPKRRKPKPTAPPEHPIAKTSLALVNEDPTYDGEPQDTSRKCNQCNIIHRGDCA